MVKCTDEDKFDKITTRVDELLKGNAVNIIIILENMEEVEKLSAVEAFHEVTKKKNVFKMVDFTRDYWFIENILDNLTADNFVVLTTKEGGRGIDMKGRSDSHVIIAFECKHYSAAVQALGRGSRNL